MLFLQTNSPIVSLLKYGNPVIQVLQSYIQVLHSFVTEDFASYKEQKEKDHTIKLQSNPPCDIPTPLKVDMVRAWSYSSSLERDKWG